MSKSWNYYFDYGYANIYWKLEFSANETELYKKEDSWYLLLFNKGSFQTFFFFFPPEQGFLSFNLLKNHLEILLKHNLRKLNTQSFWFRMESEHLHV